MPDPGAGVEAELEVVGVVLAGGAARRMGGGDKGFRELAGRPILAHILERMTPQLRAVAINAGGPPERFAAFGLPVLPDTVEGGVGPLAGVLTGLDWAAEAHPGVDWVVSIPTDAPFLPNDLVARLLTAVAGDRQAIATVRSGGRNHPVVGLWPVALRTDLREALVSGMRKVDQWTARHRLEVVDFETEPVDPFFNANRPEDLAAAEVMIGTMTAK